MGEVVASASPVRSNVKALVQHLSLALTHRAVIRTGAYLLQRRSGRPFSLKALPPSSHTELSRSLRSLIPV